ncbi:hypothetical protein ACSXDL_02135 [Clostridium perfringens]|uniref:hypothetical protein n=1 Tax=Clostridium perfringens TaxID=1502 RepID=UPI001A2CD907|nr:hypothetical protein [Clostridium perfringens]HAT4281447.1 hypothetical protein [Clostridium perfringens]
MGKIKKSNIEAYSVNEVATCLRKTGRVDPEIPIGDKSPSWDGDILFYEECDNKDFNKDDLIRKLRVQVKGREVTKFSSKFTQKSFERADLENYYNDQGVIIFLVELIYDEEEGYKHKIFYNMLLPLDLREILDSMKEQENKTIRFERFPKGKSNIVEKLSFFIRERERQSKNLVEKRVDISKFNSGSFVFKEQIKTFNEMIGKECYLYGKLENEDIDIPISKIVLKELIEESFEEISIKDRVFYKKINRVFKGKDWYEVILGNGTCLTVKNNNLSVNFKTKDNKLNDALTQHEFILGLIKEKQFSINKQIINCGGFKIEDNKLKSIEKNYEILLKIKEVFDYLNIDFDGSIFNLNIEDLKTILTLYEALINRDTINIDIDEEVCKFNLKLCDDNILLYPKKDDDGYYRVYDFFKEAEIYVGAFHKDEKITKKISIFITLSVEDICSSNFNEFNVLKSIKKDDLDEIYTEYIIMFILNIIHAFDKYKVNHLNLAINLLEYLNENNCLNNNLYRINLCQINKRIDPELNSDERRELVKIKNETESIEEKCACSILLDNKEDAEYWFEYIENKEIFKEYPIFTLLNKE